MLIRQRDISIVRKLQGRPCVLLCFLSAILSSCTFFDRIGNKPYIFPTEAQPYSEVTDLQGTLN